jgi:hypothetical protein
MAYDEGSGKKLGATAQRGRLNEDFELFNVRH